MEYIIFMIAIQAPFLYLIWRLFNLEKAEYRKVIRNLKNQNENMTRVVDTLKMSLERISEDLYGKGKINSRFFNLERNLQEFKVKLEDMEIYTGLNNTKTKFSPSSALKDKNFI